MANKNRVRQSKEVSRDKILIASLKLMNEQGWAGLSFQKIAKSCRMSPSNVVYHFSSRGDLMLALLDRISLNNSNIVQRNLKPEFNAYQRLINHFEKNLEWATDFPSEAQVILQIYTYAGHDPEFAKVFEVMFQRAQYKIAEHLLAGQREGLFHFTEEADFLARLIHNLIVGAFVNTTGSRLTTPASYPHDELARVIKRMVGYSN